MAAKKDTTPKTPGPASDKKQALETALAQIEKQFGKGAVMKLGANIAMQVDAIPTGRMFSLWMYAAIAPIPLSTFAGEPTSSVGKNFIRSYAGVCLQGVVIALSCIIFSAISSSPPAVDTGASVVTAVWTYVGELAFNLLVLVGAIKGCDRIVKEIMGL